MTAASPICTNGIRLERESVSASAPRAGLTAAHAAELDASRIGPDVVVARGYRSVHDPNELAALGFAVYQQQVPGLLIPIHNTVGRIVTHQYKPDVPRLGSNGKPVKYETPAGSRPVLDVPPAVRRVLRDRAVPLGITEGSKKADAAVSQGMHVVSICGVYGWRGRSTDGAKVPLDDFDDVALDRREVALYFDSDLSTNPNVRQALHRFAAYLSRRGAIVRTVFLPPDPTGAKVGLDDFFANCGSVEDLASLESAGTDEAPPDDRTGMVGGEHAGWPEPLDRAAFYGLAGAIVSALLPSTEADEAGLLVTLLAAVGNIAGRGPHWQVSGRRHPMLVWPVLVGATAKGRKGTSWGTVRALLEKAFPDWLATCVNSGLSSGEGLIWLVRDAIAKADGTTLDAGVADKRAFLVEEEFAGTLKVAAREGNNLSAIVRKAWDGDTLASLTKTSPGRATDPHVTIVGHTTAEELRRHLDDVQVASGLANRFFYVCVQRSKLLPDGGSLDEEVLDRLAKRLREALGSSAGDRPISRDKAASSLWRTVYGPLSEGGTGLLGAVTGRAEAQVMRLAAVYAVLDGAAVIQAEHLRAAVAVWDYSETSVRHVFGDRLGDPIADTVVQALRGGEMSQTELQVLFGRNVPAPKLNRALGMLLEVGRVEQRRRDSGPAGGRPAIMWSLRNG